MERQRAALGAARYLPHDLVLEVDEHHPISHGALCIDLVITDGVIREAEPVIGFVHRSAEKLFESRDYRQIMMLANRHDWLDGFHGELLIALTVEAALGIVPPSRATWSRVLLAELDRLTTALLWCSFSTSVDLRAMREPLLAFMQQVSGSRIHPMITRIGGLAHALPDLTELESLLPDVVGSFDAVRTDIRDGGLGGVAVISPQTVRDFDLGGVIAAASGIDRDLRFHRPYLAYAECAQMAPRISDTSADAAARLLALVDVMSSSAAIIRFAGQRLRDLVSDPIDVPLPKVVRVPHGTTYQQVESPLGMSGALLVGAGDKTPWRLKLSTPSFHVLQALPSILAGLPLTELTAALTSLPFVVGDADR